MLSPKGTQCSFNTSLGTPTRLTALVYNLLGLMIIPKLTPDGREIVTGSQGRAIDLLDENQMRPVQDILQPEAIGSVEAALVEASKHYVSGSVTSVTDLGISWNLYRFCQSVWAKLWSVF